MFFYVYNFSFENKKKETDVAKISKRFYKPSINWNVSTCYIT